MRTWLGVLIAIAACNKSADNAPAPPPPKPVAAAPADAATPKKPAPSKEQLAAYRQHMKAGWALQKQQKWAESVPAFEAAAKAIEGDQRALSELGWSAMNAGDLAKAKKADDEAVKVAVDPKVKASALFNLGTVYAKTGETERARAAYTLSLALRANKTVEAELVKLGKQPEAEKPLCAPTDDPCACLRKVAFEDFDPADPPTCGPAKLDLPVPAFKAYALSHGPWTYTYILDEHQDLVASMTDLDRMRVSELNKVEKAELQKVGGHQILWFQVRDEADQESPRDDDSIDESVDVTVSVTLCVVGDATTPTRCPLRDVPLEHTHSSTMQVDKGESATKTDLAIAADGTATVKLLSGPSDDRLNQLIGPHKLF
jgi:hypothetical protein